jgi:hypothetical protein
MSHAIWRKHALYISSPAHCCDRIWHQKDNDIGSFKDSEQLETAILKATQNECSH